MSLLVILLFIGTMALSLWATIRVRQIYNRFSLLRASSGSTGVNAAAAILRQEGIFNMEIVAHDQMLGDPSNSTPRHERT
jgi:Zn-dependent membrane protease YugP